MTYEPVISVIVPTHNVAQYLGEALGSIFAQTYKALDVIVVDDGSMDHTKEVVAAYPQVRYFWQERQGPGGARNHGVAEAQGEFLAFLDADDLWSPEKLSQQLAYYQQLPDNGRPRFVFGHGQQFFSPELDPASLSGISIPETPQPARLAGTLFARLNDFKAIGNYCSGIGQCIDWFLRARDAGADIYLMPELMLFRRIHYTNISRTNRKDNRAYVRSLKASLDRRRQSSATVTG